MVASAPLILHDLLFERLLWRSSLGGTSGHRGVRLRARSEVDAAMRCGGSAAAVVSSVARLSLQRKSLSDATEKQGCRAAFSSLFELVLARALDDVRPAAAVAPPEYGAELRAASLTPPLQINIGEERGRWEERTAGALFLRARVRLPKFRKRAVEQHSLCSGHPPTV